MDYMFWIYFFNDLFTRYITKKKLDVTEQEDASFVRYACMIR